MNALPMPVAAAAAPTADDDEAACVICKCTEDRACDGGCHWVANELGVDVCSACCERLADAIGR